MTKPTICLNMIVRNEAHIIHETLDSIRKYIDYWVICDTGSTDNTKEVIRDYFAKYDIPGELTEEPWHDHFGKNRSIALKPCAGKCKYIWVIDADDVLHGEPQFPEDMDKDYYLLKYGDGAGTFFHRQQIFRTCHDWFYSCVRHEYPDCAKKPLKFEVLEGDYFVDSRRLGDRGRDKDRYLKDALILEKHIELEPEHATRYKFYIGMSYTDHGDHEKAIPWFQKRIEAGHWFEEVFYSKFQIGECLRKLKRPWDEVEKAYLEAWRYLPSRAEPLHEIACHYRQEGMWKKAYRYATICATIDFPEDQGLFIQKDIYDWKAKDEVCVSASFLGKWKECKRIGEELLANPHVPPAQKRRIRENYNFTLNRIDKPRPMNPDKPNLVFYVGYAAFNQAEMYGSELALLAIAERLKAHYNVFLCGFNRNHDVFPGIRYMYPQQFREFSLQYSVDILVISRYIHYFIEFVHRAKKTFIWVHDKLLHCAWDCKDLPGAGKFLIRNVIDKIDKFVALTTWHKETLMNFYNLPQDKMTIIPNALDPSIFPTDVEKVPGRIIYTSNPTQCLEKVISIVHKLQTEFDYVELYVFRDKESFKPKHEHLLEELSEWPYMHFGGRLTQKDLATEFAKADIWLYPIPATTHETYCMSAIEAQCAGCYCIASDSSGLKDSVADRGILVPPGGDFYSPIRNALVNPIEKRDMQVRAQNWARAQTWDNRAQQWRAEFEKI